MEHGARGVFTGIVVKHVEVVNKPDHVYVTNPLLQMEDYHVLNQIVVVTEEPKKQGLGYVTRMLVQVIIP